MKNQSIWNLLDINSLEGKNVKETDILIIGAGLTGVLTSYFLKDSDYSVTLIDKGSVGRGVTSNSSAKISFLQRDIYQKLHKNYNLGVAKLYLESQIEATSIILDLCKKHHIDCDLRKVKSYLFANTKSGIEKLEKEKDILEKLNISCNEGPLPIGFPSKESFYVDNTYTFHPLKFICGILKEIKNSINILENTMALDIEKGEDGYLVTTNYGKIIAKKVVITCHYPFFLLPSMIPLKNHVEREYVNAAKVGCREEFCAINMEKQVKSIRYYGNYLIYVSNNHKIMNQIDYQSNYEKSRKDFKKYFKSNPEYTWVNQDLFTTDGLPLIGYASEKEKNLLIATGFNGWGMTNSIISAKVLSDLLLEKTNKYIDLFNVSRINLPMILNSTVNSIFYLKAYLEPYLYVDNQIYTKVIDGVKYNVYKDNSGKEHIVKRKCPHMKCSLIFNHEDLTWDCPCHGSRFDMDGNVVEGPAKYNIKRD